MEEGRDRSGKEKIVAQRGIEALKGVEAWR